MKYFIPMIALSMCASGALAAHSHGNSRPAMSNKIMAAPRYVASVNQLNGMSGNVSVATSPVTNAANNTGTTGTTVVEAQPTVDMREAERNACVNNNIGMGNTFVWASRYSDTSNYANMIEDTTNPQNNVCFVRVELKSDNTSRVSVSDVPAKYFMWGEQIECGSWANANEIEKRILDARKGARVGGIIASTVGGAGLGVGVMELIGNNAIAGWKGQKELTGAALYRSQLLTLKNSKKAEDNRKYEELIKELKVVKRAIDSTDSEQHVDEEYKRLIDALVQEHLL